MQARSSAKLSLEFVSTFITLLGDLVSRAVFLNRSINQTAICKFVESRLPSGFVAMFVVGLQEILGASLDKGPPHRMREMEASSACSRCGQKFFCVLAQFCRNKLLALYESVLFSEAFA